MEHLPTFSIKKTIYTTFWVAYLIVLDTIDEAHYVIRWDYFGEIMCQGQDKTRRYNWFSLLKFNVTNDILTIILMGKSSRIQKYYRKNFRFGSNI